jgi:hypothetical protein
LAINTVESDIKDIQIDKSKEIIYILADEKPGRYLNPFHTFSEIVISRCDEIRFLISVSCCTTIKRTVDYFDSCVERIEKL